ncbi:MAG: lysylphosphatidylglycerol synthase transmembrane domain-containing protein [Planctomycetota bacterium]
MAGDELSQETNRRWLVGSAKVLIGVAILWFLVSSDRLQFNALLQVGERWGAIVAAQVCFLGQLLLSFARWQVLLRAFGIAARFADVVRLGWIGLLFNQVVPGATGGDVVKGIYIARETPRRRAEAVLTIIIDRAVGLTGLMLIGTVIVALHFDAIYASELLRGFIWLLPALLICVFGGTLLLTWPPFWRFAPVRGLVARLPGKALLKRVADALYELRGRPKLVLGILGMSVVGHFLGIAMHYYLACALVGEVPDLGLFLFIDPMGQLVNAVPLTPGGVGLGETAYDELFTAANNSSIPGAELMILIRVSWLLWGAVGLYFYLKGRGELVAAAQLAEQTEEELRHPTTVSEAVREGSVDEGAVDEAPAGEARPT